MLENLSPFSSPGSHEQAPMPDAWGGVTDPAEHNPAAFRYLVHALNPYARLSAFTALVIDQENGVAHDPSWGDQSLSMSQQPERVAERVSLSMSLIDQDHPATWGPGGLIIAAPPENIVLTSEADAGAFNNNLTFLLEQGAKRGVCDGDELLRQTGRAYNEVVALAKRDDAALQLQGFFYKITASGEPIDDAVADMMRAHASRLGLPLVAIREPGAYGQDRVSIESGMLAVELGGMRYNLTGFDEGYQFCAIDEAFRTCFISPGQIAKALRFAVSSGAITPDRAAEVQQEYEKARQERETPRAVFSESGELQHITHREGYGQSEHRVMLDAGGTLRRYSIAEEKRQMTRAMLGHHSDYEGEFTDRMSRLASPQAAEKMVSQASEKLEPEQKAALAAWLEHIRPRLVAEEEKTGDLYGLLASKALPAYIALRGDLFE